MWKSSHVSNMTCYPRKDLQIESFKALFNSNGYLQVSFSQKQIHSRSPKLKAQFFLGGGKCPIWKGIQLWNFYCIITTYDLKKITKHFFKLPFQHYTCWNYFDFDPRIRQKYTVTRKWNEADWQDVFILRPNVLYKHFVEKSILLKT